MADFRKLAMAAIMADGKVDEVEVKVLQKGLKSEDGSYGNEALKFLIELREAAQKKAKATASTLTESFEKFFFKVMTDIVLKDSHISEREVGFLKDHLLADGKIDEGEWKFLETINKKAKSKHASFEEMYKTIEAKRAKMKK
ncbi:MAG: hypothetical protein EBV06_00790 [Planctomycetia bacterium]|nr:hypothetical protein [Planctomycetia bacterium]